MSLQSLSANKKHLLQWALTILFVALSAYYLTTAFDWSDAIGAARKTNWQIYWIVVPLCILASWIVRGIRWHVLIKPIAPNISASQSYLDNAVAQGFAEVTPIQSGELLKIAFAAEGTGASKALLTGAFLTERAYDVLAFGFLLAFSLIFVGIPFIFSREVLIGAAIGLILLSAIAVLGLQLVRRNRIQLFIKSLEISSGRKFLFVSSLTVIIWLIYLVIWKLVFISIDVPINTVTLIWIFSVSSLAGLLSLVPSGLGTSDATIAGLLVVAGTPPALALATMVLLRLTSLQVIALGALHWCLRRTGRFIT